MQRIQPFWSGLNVLIHCDLVMPYGVTDWAMECLVTLSMPNHHPNNVDLLTLEALKQAAETLIQNTNNFIQENAFETYCQRLQNGNNVFHASMFFSRLYFPCSAPRCNPSNYKNSFEMKTRTTRTPAFWGYPPPPVITHTIDKVVLNPKSILLTSSYRIPSQKKVKAKKISKICEKF